MAQNNKQFTTQSIHEHRYRNQFCVDPSIPALALKDPKYVYFITEILGAGAWTATIIGIHRDGTLRQYIRNGTGRETFPIGLEIVAQEATFMGVTQVCGFTVNNMKEGN